MNNCSYDDSKNMLRLIRKLNEDDGNGGKNYIAITDDPKFGQNKLSEQKNMVKSAMGSLIDFGTDPLRYYPETEEVTFNGFIKDMNNTFFQLRLPISSGTDGVFISLAADSYIPITGNNIKILQNLHSLSKTWHESWNANSELLDSYKKIKS